jgi:flagellar biosynthesis protein FlhB
MSGGDDSAEKEHEPSQKRLDDARARGEIARSPDLMTACSYSGFLLAAMAVGAQSLQAIGGLGTVLVDQADRLAPLLTSGGAAPVGGLMVALLWAVVPFLLVPGLAVFAYLVASRSLIFTPEKLAPKLSRISPFSNAKQKFGRTGLFEFAKSFVKLGVISAVLTLFLLQNSDDVIGTLYLMPALSTAFLTRLFVQFLWIVVIIAVITGGIDFIWQRAQHIRQNRMSRKDMLDESRDQDGDPHMKAQRRQRGYDIATNQMLADVAKADVIVVNPTHYAVALQWNRAAKQAPICLAKGTDEIATRIREKAAEAGIPIHSDPPTARALHATIEVGQHIRPEHYRAVAAAIRFAESMRKRARSARK